MSGLFVGGGTGRKTVTELLAMPMVWRFDLISCLCQTASHFVSSHSARCVFAGYDSVPTQRLDQFGDGARRPLGASTRHRVASRNDCDDRDGHNAASVG